MDRSNIEKIAKTPEDRVLLAKIWDKVTQGMHRDIPTNTYFLSPRELEMARFLFGEPENLHRFGGYPEAERQMLVYLPDYLGDDALWGEHSPVVCLHGEIYQADALSHRDFLGALMGSGITRESVGDICVGNGSCHLFVTAEIAPYLLQEPLSVGRTKLKLSRISFDGIVLSQPEIKEIRDTVSSLRLDSIVASGFRVGRSAAAEYITAGKVAVDGLPCEKPDKTVSEGAKISVRGLGKIQLASVGGQTKKGRISITIHRYL